MPDNTPFTVKPARRPRGGRGYESLDMSAFVRRVARAMVRRAATGDTLALNALIEMRAHVDAALGDAARELNDFGYTWADIAHETGVSRQAARQRWSREAGNGGLAEHGEPAEHGEHGEPVGASGR